MGNSKRLLWLHQKFFTDPRKKCNNKKKVKAHNSTKEQDNDTGNKCRKAEVPNEFQWARTLIRQQKQSLYHQRPNWSSTIQWKKCAKQREGRKSEVLVYALFLPPQNSRRKHSYLKTTGIHTHSGRKQEVKEQLSKRALLKGTGLEHVASRALRNEPKYFLNLEELKKV